MMLRFCIFIYVPIFTAIQKPQKVFGITATPFEYPAFQPADGGEKSLIQLKQHGDENVNYVTDASNYPVIQAENGWHVYAVPHLKSGNLVGTPFAVGVTDPHHILELTNDPKAMLALTSSITNQKTSEGFMPTRPIHPHCTGIDQENDCHRQRQLSIESHEKSLSERRLRIRDLVSSTGQLQHLVVLVKFKNHQSKRILPNWTSYYELFNSVGGNPQFAPTGSVRDVFLTSSYGKLDVVTTVNDWLTVSETESYYSNKRSGIDRTLYEALKELLNYLDDNKFDFSEFDRDGNGIIDAITFVHSGYGAEWGGQDCVGAEKEDRIWSHMRTNASTIWCSKDNICLKDYQVASGVWGRCTGDETQVPAAIAHIGVMAHEIGHFLGMPDMYDGQGGRGNGIGSYGLMGNCWGFDGSQMFPPLLDPYSKLLLGWATPIEVNSSNKYEVQAAHKSDKVYVIRKGFPEGEYLIVENRQAVGFELILPQAGLLIWHVDEKADHLDEGYPGQESWPRNGKHYKLAILSSDGNYDLEKGENLGDSTDLWHAESPRLSLGPSEERSIGPFPNTDSYQHGSVKRTGVELRNFSESSLSMTFIAMIPGSSLPKPPTPSPTRLPTYHPSSHPTSHPTYKPSKEPSSRPSISPSTSSPTKSPTSAPSLNPSSTPTVAPSAAPTIVPSVTPTNLPSANPTEITLSPATLAPTNIPSAFVITVRVDDTQSTLNQDQENESIANNTKVDTENHVLVTEKNRTEAGTSAQIKDQKVLKVMELPSIRIRATLGQQGEVPPARMLRYTSDYIGALYQEGFSHSEINLSAVSQVTLQLIRSSDMDLPSTYVQQVMAQGNGDRYLKTNTEQYDQFEFDFKTFLGFEVDKNNDDTIPSAGVISELMLRSLNADRSTPGSFLSYLTTISENELIASTEHISASLSPAESLSTVINYAEGMNLRGGKTLTSRMFSIFIFTITGLIVLITLLCRINSPKEEQESVADNEDTKPKIEEACSEMLPTEESDKRDELTESAPDTKIDATQALEFGSKSYYDETFTQTSGWTTEYNAHRYSIRPDDSAETEGGPTGVNSWFDAFYYRCSPRTNNCRA